MHSTPPPISLPLQFQDGPGKLHAFSTGLVAVKTGYLNAKGNATLSKLRFLMQSSFTDWLPIWVWVIEHPEGIFVIDTGENARVTEPDYFDGEGAFQRWINKTQFKFKVAPEEEIGPQLKRLGLSTSQLKAVVLTHLHIDHIDGLDAFPEVPIWVNRQEWEQPSFVPHSLLPDWLKPELLEVKASQDGEFEASVPLTASQELSLISTPGHTPHHCSVLVQTKDLHFFLAGDVSYDQSQLLTGVMSAGHSSFQQSRESLQRIRNYANRHQMIYLPSHDPEAGDRLKKGLPLLD
ncbi:MAG: N-acyl homoserine lactonase family protein [Bacteroidota bacterium]